MSTRDACCTLNGVHIPVTPLPVVGDGCAMTDFGFKVVQACDWYGVLYLNTHKIQSEF